MSDLNKIPKILNGTPIQHNASLLDKAIINFEWFLGQALNWLQLPGFVKPVEVYDQLTRTHVKVATGHLFTIISINGNDYYFRRLDGKYDGSGKRM